MLFARHAGGLFCSCSARLRAQRERKGTPLRASKVKVKGFGDWEKARGRGRVKGHCLGAGKAPAPGQSKGTLRSASETRC